MKINTALASFMILSAVLSGGEKVVFRDSFQEKDGLKSWRMVSVPGGAEFSIDNGGLSVLHMHRPGGGGFVEIPVPVVSRGYLDFDVTVNPEGYRGDGIGLTLDLYNISVFWHDACADWRMYFAEPTAKRLPYFDIEPVGHSKIAPIPKRKTVHYRIRFDQDSDLAEFYVGDMSDPCAARYDISVLGHAFYQGGVLRIGSFGFAPGKYRTEIRNIVLTEETGDSGEDEIREGVIVFEGISSEHFPMKKLLKEPADKIRQYFWDSPGACPNTVNNYQYFKIPGFSTVKKSKYIIFNDAPNVPEPLQKRILQSVNEGADLIIFSGLCSLGKGEFKDTLIGKALPVVLTDEWATAGNREKPIRLDAKPGLVPESGAVMYYYWNLKPTADAEVLATADNGKIPVLVRRKFGKGSIVVLCATTCGPVGKDSFWNTSFLDNFMSFLKK